MNESEIIIAKDHSLVVLRKNAFYSFMKHLESIATAPRPLTFSDHIFSEVYREIVGTSPQRYSFMLAEAIALKEDAAKLFIEDLLQ